MKKSERYTYIAICLLMLCLTIVQCKKSKNTKEQLVNYVGAEKATIKRYRNFIGTQTAGINTLQLNNKALKEAILKKNDTIAHLTKSFTNLRSLLHFSSSVNLPEAAVKFDTLQEQLADSLQSFKRTGIFQQEWYNFKYYVTSDSLKIRDINIRNTTYVVTGYKRNGLFQKPVLQTEITHSNPYISSGAIQAVEVSAPVPWYKKWYIWLMAGAVTGLVVK